MLRVFFLSLVIAGFAISSSCSEEQTSPKELTFVEDLVIGLDPAVPLGRAQDIAVDSKGNIFVLDVGFKIIRRYKENGEYEYDLGGEGEAPGEFYNPACISTMPDGRILVAGFDQGVTILDPEGRHGNDLVFKKNFSGSTFSVASDNEGNVYICGIEIMEQDMIHMFASESYEHTHSFGESYASGGDVDTRLESMYAIGYIKIVDDKIYYLQATPQALRVYNLDGEFLWDYEVRETPGPPPPVETGDGMSVTFPPLSDSIIVFESGHVMVSIFFLPEEKDGQGESIIDLYGPDGARVSSLAKPGYFSPKCVDSKGRVYAQQVREEVPVVVRYRVHLPSE